MLQHFEGVAYPPNKISKTVLKMQAFYIFFEILLGSEQLQNNMERGILMKSEKVTQILLLAAGLVFFLVGIFRGEAAVVLSKAIKLCMECVGIG